jgi:hypothetical protein
MWTIIIVSTSFYMRQSNRDKYEDTSDTHEARELGDRVSCYIPRHSVDLALNTFGYETST